MRQCFHGSFNAIHPAGILVPTCLYRGHEFKHPDGLMDTLVCNCWFFLPLDGRDARLQRCSLHNTSILSYCHIRIEYACSRCCSLILVYIYMPTPAYELALGVLSKTTNSKKRKNKKERRGRNKEEQKLPSSLASPFASVTRTLVLLGECVQSHRMIFHGPTSFLSGFAIPNSQDF